MSHECPACNACVNLHDEGCVKKNCEFEHVPETVFSEEVSRIIRYGILHVMQQPTGYDAALHFALHCRNQLAPGYRELILADIAELVKDDSLPWNLRYDWRLVEASFKGER